MSTLKTNNVQVGQSATATNNFTWYQPASPDGTVRLGVGNSGATTSDVLKISSTGFDLVGGYPAYQCRAWVNFNGTGTVAIRASGNVSSITDNGTGDYTVNLTSAMPDTNGTAAGSAVETVGTFTGGQRAVMCSFSSTSGVRTSVTFQNGGPTDCPFVGIAIFR